MGGIVASPVIEGNRRRPIYLSLHAGTVPQACRGAGQAVDRLFPDMFDSAPMQSRADFLKSLGESLASYEAPRVAKLGCFTGLGAASIVVVAGVAGWVATEPFFPRFFRLITLTLLGTILLVFAFYATLETGAEKRARRKVTDYLRESGADMETLLEMARTRRGRFPGSEKVISVLEQLSPPARS